MTLWEKGPDPISLPFNTSSVIINADGEGNAEIKLVVETPVSLDPASGAGSSTFDFSRGYDISAGFTGEGISSATFQRLKNFVSAQSGSGSTSCVINITEFLEFAGTFDGVGTASSTLTLKEFVDLVGSFTGDGSSACALTLKTFSTYHEWLDGYLNDQGKPANAIWTSDETSGTTDGDIVGSNDGTLNGSYTLGANPIVDDPGNSIDFTGGYSEIPDSADISFGSNDDFSALVWFGAWDQRAFISKGRDNPPGYHVQGASSNEDLRALVDDGSNAEFTETSGSTMSSTSGPNFGAMTVDRSTDTLKAWANNGDTATEDISAVGSLDGTSVMRVSESDGGFLDYSGRIDVRAVIPYVLNDTELQKCYDVGIDNSNA